MEKCGRESYKGEYKGEKKEKRRKKQGKEIKEMKMEKTEGNYYKTRHTK